MKVKELIQTLQKYDSESIVVLSSDEEGNGYRRAFDFSEGVFDSINKEFYDDKDEEDEMKFAQNEGVEYEPPHGERCVVLY